MNHFCVLPAVVVVALVSSASVAVAQPPVAARATIGDFAWLAGHWAGTGLRGTSEEMWMPAAGGAMLGSFRQMAEGRVTFYEILTLVEQKGTVALRLKHVNPDLTGWRSSTP